MVVASKPAEAGSPPNNEYFTLKGGEEGRPAFSVQGMQFQNAISADDIPTMTKLLKDGAVKAYGEMTTGRGWLQYAIALEKWNRADY